MTTDTSPAGAAPPEQQSRGNTGLVVLAVVLVLGLGGIAAAVISRGDSGTASTAPPAGVTVEHNVTAPAPTVSVQTKTVTAPPTTVQVQPTVTVQGGSTSTSP